MGKSQHNPVIYEKSKSVSIFLRLLGQRVVARRDDKVSPSDHPLTKKPEDSGYEFAEVCKDSAIHNCHNQNLDQHHSTPVIPQRLTCAC